MAGLAPTSSVELTPEPTSVGEARRFCSATLVAAGADDDTVSLVALLVSELVTNVVLHAGTPCTLLLTAGDRVRVEVHDHDTAPPVVKYYDDEAGSGRGMRLLEALAERSGHETSHDGKVVWFEVPCSPRS